MIIQIICWWTVEVVRSDSAGSELCIDQSRWWCGRCRPWWGDSKLASVLWNRLEEKTWCEVTCLLEKQAVTVGLNDWHLSRRPSWASRTTWWVSRISVGSYSWSVLVVSAGWCTWLSGHAAALTAMVMWDDPTHGLHQPDIMVIICQISLSIFTIKHGHHLPDTILIIGKISWLPSARYHHLQDTMVIICQIQIIIL